MVSEPGKGPPRTGAYIVLLLLMLALLGGLLYLLGRSLDEPAPTVEGSVRQPGSAPPAWSAPPAAGGADVWDAAMPLVAEG